MSEKTPEEIVWALRNKKIPCDGKTMYETGWVSLICDSADLIESLQGKISEKDHEITQLKLEKEMMRQEWADSQAKLAASQRREQVAVSDLKICNYCFCCKNSGNGYIPHQNEDKCDECHRLAANDCAHKKPLWEWRGPQDGKGETHE